MGRLVAGQWVTKPAAKTGDGYQRKTTQFRGHIRRDGSTEYSPARGRYHLYVSHACPWAHRALIGLELFELADSIDTSVTDAFMGDDGWTLPEGADPINDARFLRDVYVAGRADYTGRVSVPVLWDKQTSTIVNNESVEVLRMFSEEFDHGAQWRLWPAGLEQAVDDMIGANYNTINNGVYRCGFAGSQRAYDEAVHELFDQLDACEKILGRQRYLCGDQLTAADICLFTTLYRFDSVYNVHFKCNIRRIVDYPNLWGFARDIYQTAGVANTCHMDQIRLHYYTSHESISPRRIIPAGAPPDFGLAHQRA